MASTTITIRMDEGLKRQAEIVFDQMGMNMTTAMTIFAKTVVREGRIPFEIAVDPIYAGGNERYLREAIAALEAGKGIRHDLIEVSDDAQNMV